MSLEAALAENTAAILAHIEVLKQIDQNQQRLLAGQSAAIDKVEAPKATRSRKAKDEAPAPTPEPEAVKPAAEEPAVTESGVDDADSASEVTTDDLRQFIVTWLREGLGGKDPAKVKKGEEKATPEEQAEYGARGKFMQAVFGEFGVSAVTGITADDLPRAMFYFQRKAAGKDVDFGAEYDFTGDPAQDVGGGDDFDIG